MKLPQHPYTPSYRMKPGYLHQKMLAYKKKVDEERKAEDNSRKVTRPEEW